MRWNWEINMTAVIMLAKPYTPAKLVYPVMVSEKLDGVPAKIHITIKEDIYPPSMLVSKRILWTVQTRQGKPYVSIHSQVGAFATKLMDQGCMGTFVFIAEVNHKDETLPFKDVSGHCRRQEQCDELVLNVFDFYRPTTEGPDTMPFGKRILLAATLVRDMFWCKMIRQILVRDAVELATALGTAKAARGEFIPEGAVIRNCNERWLSGKRSWGYQKVVDDPTTEVWITDVEEATSETGEPLGMVGRLNGDWQGQRVGVGPGKLTHVERHSLWRYGSMDTRFCIPGWATVKYKRDPSYKALRQPTFQHWRPKE
jgi:hypothetical protein